MNIVTILDITFASLMALGGTAGLYRVWTVYSRWSMPKALGQAIVSIGLKNLFTFGWYSRYHLMTFWNLTCIAAIIHWNMVASGIVIAVLFVSSAVIFLTAKYRLLRDGDALAA